MATADDLAELMLDGVTAALGLLNPDARRDALDEVLRSGFDIAYEDLTGDTSDAHTDAFVASMHDTMALTTPSGDKGQPELVSQVYAVAATNAASLASVPRGEQVTWRTQQDERVRDLHRPMEGVTTAAGTPFVVGGQPLLYPGQPVGPPEVWINCRCTLESSLVAAISEEPWSNFSSADYSIDQWKRACLITMPDGDPASKGTYKLPILTPTGALSRAGVHAAASALAGGRGGVDAPPDQKAKAASKLRGAYATLKEKPPDSLKADAVSLLAWAPSTSPPGTHDGPGWMTNPRDTQRLRDYWTKGTGAGKIAWGSPKDFYRCRQQLGKYVTNQSYLDGTCANLHYVALGYWPNHGPHATGQHHHVAAIEYDDTTPEFIAVTNAFTAAATEETTMPQRAWFDDPKLDGPTPLTVTADGQVFGHLATWDTCHVGMQGGCTTAPHSQHDYAYFRTGEVDTDGGPVPVGHLTAETGHATADASPDETVSHYDNTGTVVADVASGEDTHGIWVAGMLRPGISDEQRYALKAGALSGDWRRIGGNLELVAALVVNVPGFPIPRTEMAASMGKDYALVAAAIVTRSGMNPNDIADQVVARLRQMASREQRAAALVASVAPVASARKEERIAAMTQLVG